MLVIPQIQNFVMLNHKHESRKQKSEIYRIKGKLCKLSRKLSIIHTANYNSGSTKSRTLRGHTDTADK